MFTRIAALLFALSCTALADKLVLNDGRTYEGAILEENDRSVKIKTAKATLTFPRDQVKEIVRDSSGAALASANAKLEACAPDRPESYLEAARWFAGEGKGSADTATLKRLCNIAAYTSRNQACEANLILGRALLEAGQRAEAARAFLRARNADGANAEAAKKAGELRGELETLAKRDIGAIAEALDLALAQRYEEAIPKLRRCRTLMYADRAPEHMATSLESLTDDLQRRVPCKPCGGKGAAACVPCAGKGFVSCNVCDGTGRKKGFTTGKGEEQGINGSVCRSCCGQGSVLCQKCRAERSVTITIMHIRRLDQKQVAVDTTAANWRNELKREIELTKYTSVNEENYVAIALVPGAITRGGTGPCGTCKGVKFDPPSTPPDTDSMRKFRTFLGTLLDGKTPIELAGSKGEVYDAEIVDDGKFTYRAGKWTE